MACVTLKRPLEFDPIHHSPGTASSCSPRPHKRRRCLPMCIPASHVNTSFTHSPSLSVSSFATLPNTSKSSSASPFIETTPAILQGDLAQYVREEIRRLKQHQLLAPISSPTPLTSGSRSTMDVMASEGSVSPPRTTSPSLSTARTAPSPTNKDKPLFSFKQVVHLCSQLVKERDGAVREEYERALKQRKADQYDCFVRFTADQLQRQHPHHQRPTCVRAAERGEGERGCLSASARLAVAAGRS